jgi:hypothetical protein
MRQAAGRMQVRRVGNSFRLRTVQQKFRGNLSHQRANPPVNCSALGGGSVMEPYAL